MPPYESYELETQYLRIGANYSRLHFWDVLVFQTREELERYYEEYKNQYYLCYEEDGKEISKLLPYCEEYDDEFFAKNDLFLVLVYEGSGTPRKEITEIWQDETGTWNLKIHDITSGMGTADAAYWHLFAAVPGKNYEEGQECQIYVETISKRD